METHEYFVCLGTEAEADWYHNICAEPLAAIRVGNRERVPAQRLLDVEEAACRFKTYEAKHGQPASISSNWCRVVSDQYALCV